MSNGLVKKKRVENKTFLGQLYQDNRVVLNVLTIGFMLMVIVGVPFYTKFTYGSIGTDKRMMFTGFLQFYWKLLLPFLGLHLVLFIVDCVKKKQFTLTNLRSRLAFFSVTDWCVAGYMGVVLVSYLSSDYKDVVALGNDKWTMGTLMQLSLGAGYFLISRFWSRKVWTVGVMLPVSGVLFLLGYLNRFNVWPIPMEVNVNPQFISLAGNINWYCGYLVTILFGAVYLGWSGVFVKLWHKNVLRGYLFVGFCALITNGSSSGILTMLGIFFVLLLLSVKEVHKLERYCEMALILGISCLFTLIVLVLFPKAITYQETSNNLFTYSPLPIVLVFLSLGMLLWSRYMKKKGTYPVGLFRRLGRCLVLFCILVVVLFVILLVVNTIAPGSIGALSDIGIFTFSPSWGSRRGATWMAGAMAWWELPFWKKLFGVGPDCMGEYLYNDGSTVLQNLLYTVWPNERLSNAHCEWLTVLVNLGLLGLISFGGIIITSVYRFLKKGAEHSNPWDSLVGACGLAILAYSIHNVVSFQQVLNEPAMFVILGIGAAYSHAKKTT